MRRVVLLGGGVAAIAGAAVIAAMPVSGVLRLVFVVAWAADCVREWRALRHGGNRLCALRLDADGGITGFGPDGRCEPLVLLAGSMVLRRLAWLRLRFADGSTHGELMAGDPAADPAWHRLQLIWTLRRGAFGRPQGS